MTRPSEPIPARSRKPDDHSLPPSPMSGRGRQACKVRHVSRDRPVGGAREIRTLGPAVFGNVNHIPLDMISYILSQMLGNLPTEAMRARRQFRLIFSSRARADHGCGDVCWPYWRDCGLLVSGRATHCVLSHNGGASPEAPGRCYHAKSEAISRQDDCSL